MASLRIVALEGDQTGQELLEQALRVLDPALLGIELEIVRFDLSLANRRATENRVCAEAAEAMLETGFGIKAATITPEGADDVGSPNRILREAIGGKVIVRTGRRIPGVTPVAGIHHPISVCRMAVGDAYGAKESREAEGDDEIALRVGAIRRSDCRAVAEYSFREAARIGGKVYGGPKWTVSPVYEGMLKEEIDAAAERHPEVVYEPVLIDATLAGLIGGAVTDAARDPVPEPRRRPALRPRPAAVRLDRRRRVGAAGARPRAAPAGRDGRGAARDRAGARGQGPRQPDGDDPRRRRAAPLRRTREQAARAIYESVIETVAAGTRTPDLGGHAGTTEFTDAVVALIGRKLEALIAIVIGDRG